MLKLGRTSLNYLRNQNHQFIGSLRTTTRFNQFSFLGLKYSTISSIKRGPNDSASKSPDGAAKLSEEELNKKKRRERSANVPPPTAGSTSKESSKGTSSPSKSSQSSLGWLLGLGVAVAAAYGAYEYRDYFTSSINKLSEPSSDKLLPDFVAGPFYGPDLPAGTPPPVLLVLDLERTLIGSDYDSKHGWRHVKRPGLDRFIDQLKGYYEIVIFSENDKGMTMDIMEAIGKGQTHIFGSSEAEVRDGEVIKRLDLMNRPIERIILIDDDPTAFQKFPRNALQIKPFVNINDTSDVALLELIPLLQAMVHEGVTDVRETFDDLGTRDAHEAAMEYKMRVARAKGADYKLRRRGIGALIHSAPHASTPLDASETNNIPTAMDIVGRAPSGSPLGEGDIDKKTGKMEESVEKKKGAFFSWLEEREKEKEEVEKNKLEKMNEIHQKKMAELQKQEQLKRLLEEDRLFKLQLEKERRDAKL